MKFLQRSKEGIRDPGAGVRSGCVPTNLPPLNSGPMKNSTDFNL